MDEPRRYYAKWNKSEENKYHMISLICGIKLKKKKNQNKYTNTTKQSRVIGTENNLAVAMEPETK